MKITSAFLLSCVLTIPAFAADAATKSAPAAAGKEASVSPMIPVSQFTVSAPMVLKDGVISQPEMTEVAAGGKATFTFKVAEAGEYVIHAIVSAPDDDANSFFLNIDNQPEDPLAIWDIDHTSGFEERVVSWRGSGDASSDEFSPKIFKLTAGEHKLIIIGREPAKLKSVSIRRNGK